MPAAPILLLALAAAPSVVTEADVRPIFEDGPLSAAKQAFEAERWEEAARGFAASSQPEARYLRAVALIWSHRGEEAVPALAGLGEALPAIADRVQSWTAARPSTRPAGASRPPRPTRAFRRARSSGRRPGSRRRGPSTPWATRWPRRRPLRLSSGPPRPPTSPGRTPRHRAPARRPNPRRGRGWRRRGRGAQGLRGLLGPPRARRRVQGVPLAPAGPPGSGRRGSGPGGRARPGGGAPRVEPERRRAAGGGARRREPPGGVRTRARRLPSGLRPRPRLPQGAGLRAGDPGAEARGGALHRPGRAPPGPVRARRGLGQRHPAGRRHLVSALRARVPGARPVRRRPLLRRRPARARRARRRRRGAARRAGAALSGRRLPGRRHLSRRLAREARRGPRRRDRRVRADRGVPRSRPLRARPGQLLARRGLLAAARPGRGTATRPGGLGGGRAPLPGRLLRAARPEPPRRGGPRRSGPPASSRGEPEGGFRYRSGPARRRPALPRRARSSFASGSTRRPPRSSTPWTARRSPSGQGAPAEPLLLLAELLERAGDIAGPHTGCSAPRGARCSGSRPPAWNLRVWQMAYPPAWRDQVVRFAPAAGVPPDLLQALMREESALDPAVVSSAGAVGLTQLMLPHRARTGAAAPLPAPPRPT